MSGDDAMGGITGNADADAASGVVRVQRFERGSVPFLMSDFEVSGRASPPACSRKAARDHARWCVGYIGVLQVACAGTAERLA